MPIDRTEMMFTVRSASFNADIAAELLLELGRVAPSEEMAARILDIAQQIQCDAIALEELFKAMREGHVGIRQVEKSD